MARRKTRTLDDWMDEQRKKKGMSWEDVAQEAKVSKNTLINIRQGQAGYPKTIRNIEAALGWTLGSIQSIKDGAEPTVVVDPLLRPAPGDDEDPAVQLRAIRQRMGATAFWREVEVMKSEEATLSRTTGF